MARFLKLGLDDVDKFTAVEIKFLCDDRVKEIENERSFWEGLFAWLICTIMNMFSKRKFKVSDLLKKKSGDSAKQFQQATAQISHTQASTFERR